MKTSVVPYQTATKCLRIECRNGTVVRLTKHPVDLVMSNGQVYKSDSGYDFTAYTSGSGMSPAAIDLEGFAAVTGIDYDKLSSGVFDNARCYLFSADWRNPVEDDEPITASIFGKTQIDDDRYKIEEMALVDALNQSVGSVYSATCTKTFGGQEFAGCKKALGPLTVTGTLTGVTSGNVFRDAARSEAVNYFVGGTVVFTSGNNAGLKAIEIKSYAADGTITTFEPFYYAPQPGDAYTMIPGCDKSLATCRDRWGNSENFGGFPYVPTSSQYAVIGTK